MEKIDFVIPWVDGSDPEWRARKWAFSGKDPSVSNSEDANSECRYRDNGLLRYWFRGVEAFAPWVNKVFFITCGQKPSWLNLDHPKLRWIEHSDFIPDRYLPTFNANTIEMNFHRIGDLSEKYVYFNDDMFLLRPVEPDLFFKDGVPVLESDLRYSSKVGYNNWSRLVFNDYCLVNKAFDIADSIWNNRRKWFNIKALGYKRARKNLVCFLANRTLPVGIYGHIALPHLKSTLQDVWDRYPEVMDSMSASRFRSDEQVNQWLLCAWNQAAGRFYPTQSINQGRIITIGSRSIEWIKRVICSQSWSHICLNENEESDSIDSCMRIISEAFDSILPKKSAFEID